MFEQEVAVPVIIPGKSACVWLVYRIIRRNAVFRRLYQLFHSFQEENEVRYIV
jgi:hypothetical protein